MESSSSSTKDLITIEEEKPYARDTAIVNSKLDEGIDVERDSPPPADVDAGVGGEKMGDEEGGGEEAEGGEGGDEEKEGVHEGVHRGLLERTKSLLGLGQGVSADPAADGEREKKRLVKRLQNMIYRGIVKPEDMSILKDSEEVLAFLGRVQNLSEPELRILISTIRTRTRGSMGTMAVDSLQSLLGTLATYLDPTGDRDGELRKEIREDKLIGLSLDEWVGDTLDELPSWLSGSVAYVGHVVKMRSKRRKLLICEGKVNDTKTVNNLIAVPASSIQQPSPVASVIVRN